MKASMQKLFTFNSPRSKPWLALYPKHELNLRPTPAWGLLEQVAERNPDHVGCVYGKQQTTWQQVSIPARKTAQALQALGVGHGDRVGILLLNIPEYPIALNGIWMAGGVAVALSPLSVPHELSDLLQATDCRYVICLDLLAPLLGGEFAPDHMLLCSLCTRLPRWQQPGYAFTRLHRLRSTVDGPQRHNFDDKVRSGDGRFDPVKPASTHDAAYILATGGTTGRPQAVTLSHNNLVANARQLYLWSGGCEGSESILAVLPFFHTYGLTSCLMAGAAHGATVIIHHRFNPRVTVKLLTKYRPTFFPAVSMMLAQLNSILRAHGETIATPQFCVSGGAPLHQSIAEEFHRYTGAIVVESFGLSEASPVTHIGPLDGTNRPGTIGLPPPGTGARIVDAHTGTRDVAPGQVGELAVRGPQVMVGYWRDSAATAGVIRDGWLHTGDLAVQDAQGFFRIVDRTKDLIITSGFNVYSNDVEHILRECPGVCDVAIIAAPDRERGELVKAIVAVPDPAAFSRDAFQRFSRANLSRQRRPRIVEVVQGNLPRNFLGKVVRRQLRSDPEPATQDRRPQLPSVPMTLSHRIPHLLSSPCFGTMLVAAVIAVLVFCRGFGLFPNEPAANPPEALNAEWPSGKDAVPQTLDHTPGVAMAGLVAQVNTDVVAEIYREPDPPLMCENSSHPGPCESGATSGWTSQRAISQLDRASLFDRDALTASLSLLEQGYAMLSRVTTYSAMMAKQERIDGTLGAHEVIELKVRHEPFAVYMKWLTSNAGRELLYVDQQYDQKLLVRLGGVKGRLLPTLKLDPWGSRALSGSRYPITDSGLLELCDQLIGCRRGDLDQNRNVRCEIRTSIWNARDSYFVELEYRRRRESPIYRRTELHIDREMLLPVWISNFTWPASDPAPDAVTADESTLLEHFQYTNVQLDAQLADIDFDRTNTDYRLR